MDISVVVPLIDEQESLPELEAWIRRVMEENRFRYEIIFIDDGSRDNSWPIIVDLQKNNPSVKGIKFRRNYGKSAGLQTGFSVAQGRVVITMDADLQDSPDEIPELYRMIIEDKYDLVSGWKKVRHDPLSKTIPTKIYNWATRKMSGINLHDFNCGLKAYRLEVVKCVEVYGEMHRYIPVMAKWAGFFNIGEKVVEHRARKYGTTKFGLSRFINGPLDLLSIMFVSKFGKRPMHFFGTWGLFMFLSGFFSAAYVGFSKWYRINVDKMDDIFVTENPWFFISLTLMLMGTMLFLTGFLAELVARNSSTRNHYLIEKEI